MNYLHDSSIPGLFHGTNENEYNKMGAKKNARCNR